LSGAEEKPEKPHVLANRKAASDKELKKKRKVLLSSKSGVLIATMMMAVIGSRDQIRKGKVPLGMGPRELDQFLSEIINGFVHLRDAYVDEVESRASTEAKWREFIESQEAQGPRIVTAH
jgi:hypothetical protein